VKIQDLGRYLPAVEQAERLCSDPGSIYRWKPASKTLCCEDARAVTTQVYSNAVFGGLTGARVVDPLSLLSARPPWRLNLGLHDSYTASHAAVMTI
jgi:hypothetical protein